MPYPPHVPAHAEVGGSEERMQQINEARDQAVAWLRTAS